MPTESESTSESTVDDAIAEVISGPQSSTVDGVTMSEFSPSELIAAARFLAAQKASKKPHRGIRFSKIVSGGAS